MFPEISLKNVSKEDVQRIARWLSDEEVCASWFGRGANGDPIHLGYVPAHLLRASRDEWNRIFHDPRRVIFSIYTAEEEHIGEAQVVMEEALGNAELSILIGRKDLWGMGYGTATTTALLDLVFTGYGLYRVWVDVPEYNSAALGLFRKMGFMHEGTMRKSRPYLDDRADSFIMGLLATEYSSLLPERELAALGV